MTNLFYRDALDLRHQSTYRQRTLSPHARTHPAAGKGLTLIGAHTAACCNLANLTGCDFFAATDDSVIFRQLKLGSRRKGVVKKTAQPALAT